MGQLTNTNMQQQTRGATQLHKRNINHLLIKVLQNKRFESLKVISELVYNTFLCLKKT